MYDADNTINAISNNIITDNIINIMIHLFKCLGTPKKTITGKHERWNKEQKQE
jgi:hypothetical protein